MTEQPQKRSKLVPAGYIIAGLALIILPGPLGVAATIIGAVNLIQHRTTHGILQVILGPTCGALGIYFGMLTNPGPY